jgi:hypothetical protein
MAERAGRGSPRAPCSTARASSSRPRTGRCSPAGSATASNCPATAAAPGPASQRRRLQLGPRRRLRRGGTSHERRRLRDRLPGPALDHPQRGQVLAADLCPLSARRPLLSSRRHVSEGSLTTTPREEFMAEHASSVRWAAATVCHELPVSACAEVKVGAVSGVEQLPVPFGDDLNGAVEHHQSHHWRLRPLPVSLRTGGLALSPPRPHDHVRLTRYLPVFRTRS